MDAMVAVQANHEIHYPDAGMFSVLFTEEVRNREVPLLYQPVYFRQFVYQENQTWLKTIDRKYSLIRSTLERIIVMGTSDDIAYALEAKDYPVYFYRTLDGGNQGIGELKTLHIAKVKTTNVDGRGGSSIPVYSFELELM